MSRSISLGDALSWLDGHANMERNSHAEFPPPSLEKVREALRQLGDPQKSYASIHITGTNGKGSTARMVTSLLLAHGLRVGTYLSPHLEKVNERILVDMVPISDRDLADELLSVKLLEEHSGVVMNWFEIMTAACFLHFDSVGVDVAVVEVGMGGKWDATNVIDGDVAIVTNVSLDHADVLGPELSDIAVEKSGIIKGSSRVVLGVPEGPIRDIFLSRPNSGTSVLGRDVMLQTNRQAMGGRVISLRTRRAAYDQLFLPLYGPHQGDNASLAISAVEEFFDRPLDAEVVRAALERSNSPGRMEVLSRSPLVIVDAAHNPAGMRSTKAAIVSDFSAVKKWHAVVSMLVGRDPRAMFLAFGREGVVSLALAPTRSLRAMEVAAMADGARYAGFEPVGYPSVTEAVSETIAACGDDEGVIICGSIYSAAEARESLGQR